MIELQQFPYAWGINPSPFCLKVETYLKLTGLPFRTVRGDPRRAPKGKLPVIVDNGRIVPDSGFILDYLKATYGDPLDSRLTAEEKALGHLVRRTCEESLFFTIVYSRWIDSVGWAAMREALFGQLPPPLRFVAPVFLPLIRKGVSRSLYSQGYGRHSRDEIYAMGISDLDAIEGMLPADGFLFGTMPSTYDLSIYGMLVSLVKGPINTPLNAHARNRSRLTGFVAAIDALIAGHQVEKAVSA